jgi:hypothetical protein
MSGGTRKTKDSGFEKGLYRPSFKWGSGYSLLKPRHFENQATEHDNRIINM